MPALINSQPQRNARPDGIRDRHACIVDLRTKMPFASCERAGGKVNHNTLPLTFSLTQRIIHVASALPELQPYAPRARTSRPEDRGKLPEPTNKAHFGSVSTPCLRVRR